MSDHDKMMAFGNWLTSRRATLTAEMYSIALDVKKPVDALRIKAGHLEGVQHVLEAFTELYNGELTKFMEDYLGQQREEEEKGKESTDG